MDRQELKKWFLESLQDFAKELTEYLTTETNEWTIKGFIDVFKNIYTITSDTKIVSKILEIHLFPKFLEFSEKHNLEMVFADKQNWYPDISFIMKEQPEIKFAVDLKTTYITKYKDDKPYECNGFTLGSHGEYFINRTSNKNIQFPYAQYVGHYVLGILYERNMFNKIDETRTFSLNELENIPSVVKNFVIFAQEKWRIASDRSGSGNTANIGSVRKIDDLISGRGIFWQKFGDDGEKWFDEYWMNYGKITITDDKGNVKRITNLKDYLKFKGLSND